MVAAALRDAGMEVIYTGLHQSPDQIVEAALQEDVDVVALSILSGAHMTLFPEVLELMEKRGLGDRLLTGGGIIPSEDMDALSKMGVGRLFGPGTSTQDIAVYIRDWFGEQQVGRSDGAQRRVAVAETRRVSARSGRGTTRKTSAKRGAKKMKKKVGARTSRSGATSRGSRSRRVSTKKRSR